MRQFVPALLIAVLFANFSNAQEKDNGKGRERLLEEIREEKIRKAPIKIEDALKASEAGQQLHLKTTGTSIEKKISTSTSNTTEEGEAFIAINPNNPAQLVLSFMNENPSLTFPVYFSNDSGNNWTKSSFNPLTRLSQDFPGGFVAGGGDPIFAYDKNGKLFFTWIYLALGGNQDTVYEAMYWASSTNNGQTFTYVPGAGHFIGLSKMDPLTQEAFPGADGFYDRQWFAVDRSNGSFSGRLYTSFLYIPTPLEPFNMAGTWIRSMNNGTDTWSTKTQAFTGLSQFANVAVDNAGTLHVTFADVDQNNVFHVSSTNGGQTFSTPHLVYSGTNLFGNQGGGIVHDRENSAVSLAVDGSNNLHLVWSDFNTGSAGFMSFYSRSTNGGVSWSTPVDITTMLPANLNPLMPVVSAFGNKVTIGVYGVGNGNFADYYNITSVNNGVSWGASNKISTQQTNFAANSGKWFGDYYNSVRTSCKVYNIWSDGRGTSGSKMYVSVTNECNALGVEELTPINGSYAVKNMYPNPASNDISIHINSNEGNEVSISVLDITGKELSTTSKPLTAGDNLVKVDIHQLAAGHYVLKMQSKDGYKYTRVIQKN